MRTQLMSLLLLAGCQQLYFYDDDAGFGGGGGSAGGGLAGGGAAGGAVGGGSAGGVTGGGGGGAGGGAGASGGGMGGGAGPDCDAGCNGCGCDRLCFFDAGPPTCGDGGLCRHLPGGGRVDRIWGVAADNLWVSKNAQLFHFDGGTWECVDTPLSEHRDLWASATEAWVVGLPSAGTDSVVRVGLSGGLVRYAPGISATGNAVWGDGAGVLVATGSGTIAARRGSGAFISEDAGSRVALSLHGAGGVYWAGSETGVLTRTSSGTTWRFQDVSDASTVSVMGTVDGGAYSATANGVYRYVGGNWVAPDAGPRVSPAVGHSALAQGNREIYARDGVSLFREDPTLGWQRVLLLPSTDFWVAPNAQVWLTNDVGVTSWQAPECPDPTLPIADDFNDSVAPRWVRFGGPGTLQAVSGGELSLDVGMTAGAVVGMRAELPTRGFRGTSLQLELVQRAFGSEVATYFFAENRDAGDNEQLKMDFTDTSTMHTYVGRGDMPRSTWTVPNGHRFMRIREDAGTVRFETAAGSRGPWTTLESIQSSTVAFLDRISTVAIGVYSRSGGASTIGRIDNVNRCP